MRTPSSCDNCQKVRHLHHGFLAGMETSQCWECMGLDAECDVCGEQLEGGRCLWCFGDPNIDKIRTALQAMQRENQKTLVAIRSLAVRP